MAKHMRASKTLYGSIFLFALILIISGFLVRQNMTLVGPEAYLTSLAYNLPVNLFWPAMVITQFGSAWFALLLIGFLAFTHKYQLALQLAAATFLAYLLTEGLKFFIHRPRPPELIPGIISREPLTVNFGFPSGHTAMITVLAIMLWPLVPARFRGPFMLVVFAVPITRIYLGVHSPLDIIGGICIGVIAVSTILIIKCHISDGNNKKSS